MRYEEYLQRQLEDEEVKKEYEALEPEYQIIRAMLDACTFLVSLFTNHIQFRFFVHCKIRMTSAIFCVNFCLLLWIIIPIYGWEVNCVFCKRQLPILLQQTQFSGAYQVHLQFFSEFSMTDWQFHSPDD